MASTPPRHSDEALEKVAADLHACDPSTVEMRESSDTHSERTGGPFGGMDAAEAARRRWAMRDHSAATVVVPVEHKAILDALARQAKQGNANAAREYRAYLADLDARGEELELSELDKARRDHLRALLEHQKVLQGCVFP